MNHDILGEIRQSPDDAGDAVATIEFDSRKIDVHIILDGQPLETTLELAANVVAALFEYDRAAKRIVVADLRGTYNSGWNEYNEVQKDGSRKSVSKPQLSEREFETQFSLIGINVTGSDVVELFYEDGGLFWGHSVIVTSLTGIDFSGAHAELFG